MGIFRKKKESYSDHLFGGEGSTVEFLEKQYQENMRDYGESNIESHCGKDKNGNDYFHYENHTRK